MTVVVLIDVLKSNLGDSSVRYNDMAEIYEEVHAIVQIAEKRNCSWQKFCEADMSILELLLDISVLVECCSKEIIRLFELAIMSNSEKTLPKPRRLSESDSKRKRSKSISKKSENFVDKLW